MLGLALFSNGIPARAGYVDLPEVYVEPGVGYGSTAGARYSGDNQQYIGCSLLNNGTFVMCLATDKTGKSAACASTEHGFATAVKAITDFSFLYFDTSVGSSLCHYIHLRNVSLFLR